MMPQRLTEAQIERQCSDLLAADGWRMLKTDPVSRREWGKGFGEKGMADCLYIRYDIDIQGAQFDFGNEALSIAQIMWIEWKRPGGKAAARQRAWHQAERARGALTLIAGEDFPADFDGFRQWYEVSGLNRHPQGSGIDRPEQAARAKGSR